MVRPIGVIFTCRTVERVPGIGPAEAPRGLRTAGRIGTSLSASWSRRCALPPPEPDCRRGGCKPTDPARNRPVAAPLERPARCLHGRRRSDCAETGRIRRTDLGVGRGQRPPLADRAALRQVPRPPRAGHPGRFLAGARRRLLCGARVRHRRPPRQDVPGRHQRPERPDDRRECPRPGRLRDRPQGGRRPSVVRDRARYAAQLARVRRALRRGARGGRVQGLPLPRAAFDPPAHARRPVPQVRRRDHDHRVAQRAVGQRLQVLRLDRRPGHPARRLRDHRLRPGRLRPRDPRDAVRRGAGRRLDRPGRPRGRRELLERRRQRVGQPGPGPLDRLHPDARGRRDLRRRRPDPRRVRQAQHPRLPAHPRRRLPERPRPRLEPRDPQDARRLDRRGEGHRRRPRPRQRPRRRPDRRGCSRFGRSEGRLDDPQRQPDRRPDRGVRDEGDRGAGAAPERPLRDHDAGQQPDGPRPLRARRGPDRGRPARRLQVDRSADRRGRVCRLPVRLRGVARLPQGGPRPRQGRGGRRPPLRRAGRHGQGPQADDPRVSRRPLHRRRPSRRAPDQQGDRGPPRRRANEGADGGLPRLAAQECWRLEDHRGLRLSRARDPLGRRLRCDPTPPRAVRRPPHLPDRGRRHALRRPAVGYRAQDQVLPLRPQPGRRPRTPGRGQGRDPEPA